jgi:hypothetical protein
MKVLNITQSLLSALVLISVLNHQFIKCFDTGSTGKLITQAFFF